MILMSWIFFSCVTQSMFSSHLDMTLSSLTNVRSSAWLWVWCSPELVTFSFNGCCSLWCSPANIVIIMIINLHNKAWFSSVVWKSFSELSRLWSANFKREQDGKGGMKVGEDYVSYYHPLSFVNMTILVLKIRFGPPNADFRSVWSSQKARKFRLIQPTTKVRILCFDCPLRIKINNSCFSLCFQWNIQFFCVPSVC